MDSDTILLAILEVMERETDPAGGLSADGEAAVEELLAEVEAGSIQAYADYCMEGQNAHKPGPCPTGQHDQPAGQGPAASKVSESSVQRVQSRGMSLEKPANTPALHTPQVQAAETAIKDQVAAKIGSGVEISYAGHYLSRHGDAGFFHVHTVDQAGNMSDPLVVHAPGSLGDHWEIGSAGLASKKYRLPADASPDDVALAVRAALPRSQTGGKFITRDEGFRLKELGRKVAEQRRQKRDAKQAQRGTDAAHAAAPQTFADTPPADSGKDVALSGPDGQKVESLLARSRREGAATLARLAEQAVKRLLARGAEAVQGAKHLFDAAELQELADQLAATNATAELLGRARIAARAQQVEKRRKEGAAPASFSDQPTDFHAFDEAAGLAPMPPREALDYFLNLYPRLGVDPLRWGPLMERQAFTLSVATDEVLLGKVQGLIGDLLATGQDVRGTQDQIAELLDQAGVSPRNPQFSEMVVRTNLVDAYNTGGFRELKASADVFPTWRYSNPRDLRSRPSHAARDGRYYSVDVPFVEVRGLGIEDAANDRCTFIPVDADEWTDLQKQGKRVEVGPPW